MVEFNADKLGTAEFGKNYKQNYNKFGGSGGAYLGSFQMGRAAWTDAGGDGNTWDMARAQYRASGSQIIIGYEEQEQRARRYWTLCGSDYLGWNLGLGNATKLKSAPASTINELMMCKVVRAQAYARGIDCDTVTAAQIITRATDYYNKGSTGPWSGKKKMVMTGQHPASINQKDRTVHSGV